VDPVTTLDAVADLYRSLGDIPDRRSAALKGLPHASDPDSSYYRFLYEWSRRHRPAVTLEIGSYLGSSAAHMAAGNRKGHVWTIDHSPDAVRHVEELGLENVTAVLSDSGAAVDLVSALLPSPVDLLYIDGWHSYDQTRGEYHLYRPLVRPGGLMLFDDVDLPTETREMQRFWEEVEEPKLLLPALHHTGFGAVARAE
jgi:predicted O-methyltransferase YrrM